MMSNTARHIITALCCFVILNAVFLQKPKPVHAAASLTISPGTSSMTSQESRTFTISIQTDGNDVFGADAIISYPVSAFEYVSAQNGSFFSDFAHAVDTANGIISLHGYFSSLFETKNGTGTLATFILKAKQTNGNATVSFVCGSGSQSSQVLNADGQNIVSCSALNQSSITFTSTNPTPTPTGVFQNIAPDCTGLSVQPSSGTKPATVTFVCSGKDTDNDIVGAEFNFGNGTTKFIERNVGQYGSLTATYTYTASNTYLVSCRIKDNNQAYSSTPSVCQRSIIVADSAYSQPTPTKKPSSGNTVPIILTGATPAPIHLKPYLTPTPLPSPTISPTMAPDKQDWWTDTRISQLMTMLAVSGITIIIAFTLKHVFDKQ